MKKKYYLPTKLGFVALLTLLLAGNYSFGQNYLDACLKTVDFEEQSNCSDNCGDACNITGIFTNVTTNPNETSDWAVHSGATSSGSTGPSVDNTLGTAVGKYIYIESSNPCNPDISAYLISEGIDLSAPGLTSYDLSFAYHMYGSSMGDLFVDVSNDFKNTWTELDSINDNVDLWQQRTVNLDAYIGDTIFIRFRGETGNNFYSDMAIDDISIGTMFPDDAGISALIAPMNPITPGNNNVDVEISNYGTSTLTTADIAWSIDGTSQPVFNWTGNLATGAATNTGIGSYNFNAGVTNLKAWSTNPNGTTEFCNSNDTLEVTLCTALNGTYTLGSGGDFPTFNDLAFVLNTCGVSGPVVVNVLPGTYNERLLLNEITGVSAVNTVTIDGADTSAVTLSNPALSNILLNGTDWVTIQNITLENTGTADAYGVQLTNNAENNTIKKCKINLSTATGLNDVIGVSASNSETSSFGEGPNAFFTLIDSVHIFGGEKAIHFEGENLAFNTNNTFSNNLLENQEDYGFYCDNQDSLMILNNTIKGLVNNNADGIYLFDQMMFMIEGNHVVSAPDYGLYIADGNFDEVPSSRGRIINNVVSSVNDYACYLDDIEETDVWHNTFYSEGARAAFRVNDMVGLAIQNNVFTSKSDYAFESLDQTTSTVNTIDYNLYWTPASNALFVRDGGTDYADLNAWQTAVTTHNVNSIETDPVFLNPTDDLHMLSPLANNAGDNSLGINVDIDGQTRPLESVVDMGADEYIAEDNDLSLVELFADVPCGNNATDVSAVVRSLGVNTVNNATITVDVTGTVTQQITFNYTGPLDFNEYDTVVVGSINTYNGGVINLSGYVDLTGDTTQSNDSLINTYSQDFIPYEPVGIDAEVCDVDTAVLYGLGNYPVSYQWYDAPTGGNLVAAADSFVVPSIINQDTYYIEYDALTSSLTTTYAGGNGCDGNMFDLSTTTSTSVSAFDINIGTTGSADVEVYYMTNGSYVGNENNAAAWTLEGSYTVTAQGAGNPTNVTLNSAIPVTAGQVTAIYIHLPNGNIDYTNGANTYTNGILTVNTGIGLCGAFGTVNNPRSFNGTIYTESVACSTIRTPVTATSLTTPTEPNLGNDTTICEGNSIQLDGTTNATDYNWNTGETTATITLNNVTTADTAIVIASNGSCSVSDSIVVDINPLPVVSLGNDTTICEYDVLVLDAGSGFADYNWASGTTTQTDTVQSSGTQTVTVTDANGCSNSSSVTITFDECLSVDEFTFANGVSVYPNPNAGTFNLQIEDQQGAVKTEIYSTFGRLIYSNTFEDDSSEHTINLTNVSTGTYFIKIYANGEQYTEKLVINK